MQLCGRGTACGRPVRPTATYLAATLIDLRSAYIGGFSQDFGLGRRPHSCGICAEVVCSIFRISSHLVALRYAADTTHQALHDREFA
jgi:hypothetical protein